MYDDIYETDEKVGAVGGRAKDFQHMNSKDLQERLQESIQAGQERGQEDQEDMARDPTAVQEPAAWGMSPQNTFQEPNDVDLANDDDEDAQKPVPSANQLAPPGGMDELPAYPSWVIDSPRGEFEPAETEQYAQDLPKEEAPPEDDVSPEQLAEMYAGAVTNPGPPMQPSVLVVNIAEDVESGVTMIRNAQAMQGLGGPVLAAVLVKPRSLTSFSITIPPECYVLWNHSGANSPDVPAAGRTTFCTPFYKRVSHLVSRQAFTYNCPVAEVPTLDNVMCKVDAVLNFKITQPDVFILRIGVQRADELLKAGCEEGLRKLARRFTVGRVKMLRGQSTGPLLDIMNKKFRNTGLEFQSARVTEVTMPPELIKALSSTAEMMATLKTLKRQHEVAMVQKEKDLEISMNDLKRTNIQEEQDRQGTLRNVEVDGSTMLMNMQEESATAIARAKAQVDVMKANARAEVERSQNSAQRDRAQVLNAAKEETNQIRIKADYDMRAGILDSLEELAQAERQAKAIALDAEVENNVAKEVALQRAHERSIAEKKVLAKLAAKGHFNLVGKAADLMLASLMEGDFNLESFRTFKA